MAVEHLPIQLVDLVNVCKVTVEGIKRTKNDIIVEQVKGLLGTKTLTEMFECSHKCRRRLESMNVFKDIEITYDVCHDKKGVVNGVKVIYKVEEAGLIKSSVSANAGTQTSDASIRFTLRNVFGRGEQIRSFSTTAFPNWGTTTGLEFYKPYYADLYKRLIISINNTNYGQLACGYHLRSIGPKLELQFPSLFGNHSLSYSLDWRQIYDFDNGVPMSIRDQAGHTVNSSIKHVFESDNRDNTNVPCNGGYTKMSHEVAGLGGDVFYGKLELQTESYKQLINNLVGGVSLWCGILKPFLLPSKINDRFLLGGSTTIRGFQMWGLGPRRGGYSLGGDIYWAIGLHLYHPLPYMGNKGLFQRIRLHAFSTMGNLTNIDKLSTIIKDTRISCGFGLQARIGLAIIELNYVLPLRALSTDWIKPGLQFGIGMNIL